MSQEIETGQVCLPAERAAASSAGGKLLSDDFIRARDIYGIETVLRTRKLHFPFVARVLARAEKENSPGPVIKRMFEIVKDRLWSFYTHRMPARDYLMKLNVIRRETRIILLWYSAKTFLLICIYNCIFYT